MAENNHFKPTINQMNHYNKKEITVNADFEGKTLINFLRKNQQVGLPIALLHKLIRNKKITVNGQRVREKAVLQKGDVVVILGEKIAYDAHKQERKKEKINISPRDIQKYFYDNIIYEDENIFVINKPMGLAVQGGNKVAISLDAVLEVINENNKENNIEQSLKLTHRLDKETTGCLVIAKNRAAANAITQSFKDRTIIKKYHALVVGDFPDRKVRIAKKLGSRRSAGGAEKVVVDEINGKLAISEVIKLKQINEDIALVEVEIKTGRKHQIRVHLSDFGYPILGDGKYGGKDAFTNKGGEDIFSKYKINFEGENEEKKVNKISENDKMKHLFLHSYSIEHKNNFFKLLICKPNFEISSW